MKKKNIPKISEKLFSQLVLLNAILAIGNTLPHPNWLPQHLLPWLQTLCLWTLTLELGLRIQNEGWNTFQSSKTNVFELGLGILLLPALLTPVIPQSLSEPLLALSLLKTAAITKSSRALRNLKTWIAPIRESALQTCQALLLLIGCMGALFLTAATIATGLLGPYFPKSFGTLLTTCSTLIGRGEHPHIFWPVLALGILFILWIGAALAAHEMTAKRHHQTEQLLRNIHGEMISLHDQLRRDLKLDPSNPPQEEKCKQSSKTSSSQVP